MTGIRNRNKQLAWLLAASALLVGGCNQPAPSPAKPQPAAAATGALQVGGQSVVTLKRAPTSNGAKPEFLSLTLLPGRGMNMFQITANIPGIGVTPLLNSGALEELAGELNGSGKDEYGNLSFTFGGAFLIPYPNRILGTLSSDGTTITTEWRGHAISLPANWQGKGSRKIAMHGLILADKTDDLQTQNTPDGQTETGVIHAGNFGGHWLSDTDLSFNVALSGDAVEVSITAKNVGNELEPMAIGWHPYFIIPSGDRSQARLHVPGSMIAPADNYDDVFPTGQLKAVKGTVYDYTKPGGVALDNHYLDDNFSHLQRTDGAVHVTLTDPKSNYGIDIDGLSPEIKTVQVYAPPDKPYAAIEEQFNYADPFGKEWKGMDTGMVTLRPGQSVTWKVRLRLTVPGGASK